MAKKVVLSFGSSLLALFLVVILCLIGIYGCGKMETQKDITGSIAPSEKKSGGGSLYEKYKDKFPANLMELTADDMINKLTPYVIQAPDGETMEVYVTLDVAEEIVKEVEESYPKYDPEKYLNEEAEKILKQNPALQSIILSGVGTSELDKDDILEKSGYTEEEFKETMLEKLENKEKRIAAEKSYIIFSEFAEPEIQAQIKASVAEIQASIDKAKAAGQYIDLKSWFGRGPNYHEMKLLFRHPHYWLGTINASKNAWDYTRSKFGDKNYYNFNQYWDDNKPNAFQHSLWNVLLAKYNEGAAWWGKRDALWWAEAFSNAHEETPDNPLASKNMDLHNNRVGRRLYDQQTYDSAVWVHIYFLWWKVATIHYRNIACSPSVGTFVNILYNRARNGSSKVDWVGNRLWTWDGRRNAFIDVRPGLDQLVYLKD